MAAPTAPRKNFITRDHRYVYLGGSFIALLGLGMFYSAPSPYSFIPAQSVFGTALAAICWFFLGVSAMALLVKWAYWNNYSSTIMKRPLIVRVSRYLSYLDAAACALLVLDRFILKLAYIINAAIHADSNPTDTLSMMAYMAYNQRSLFAIGNEFIINIKDSSVLCVVGVSDLMFMTRSVAGIYYKGTECYLIAAIVYLFLTYLSSLLLKAITGKMTAPDNTKRHQGNQTVDLGLPSSN